VIQYREAVHDELEGVGMPHVGSADKITTRRKDEECREGFGRREGVGAEAFQKAINHRVDGPIAPTHQEPGASLLPGLPGQSPDLIRSPRSSHLHLPHHRVGLEAAEDSRISSDPAGIGVQDEKRSRHDGLPGTCASAVFGNRPESPGLQPRDG